MNTTSHLVSPRSAAAIYVGGQLLLSSFALAQGPLTPPPGTPAPTMKSLEQIEPRTPISTMPFVINTGGHYYLTKSIATTGDGITIQADDVVVDLNGFTLSGDAGGTDAGVQTAGLRARIAIRNGTVRGFGSGLVISTDTSQAVLEDLVITGNSGPGLFVTSSAGVAPTNCVFRRLRVTENGGAGFSFSNIGFTGDTRHLVDQCQATNNGGIGFSISTRGNLMIRCVASGNGTNYSISINNRFGIIVTPPQNATVVSGNSGGAATTTDPFANITY